MHEFEFCVCVLFASVCVKIVVNNMHSSNKIQIQIRISKRLSSIFRSSSNLKDEEYDAIVLGGGHNGKLLAIIIITFSTS